MIDLNRKVDVKSECAKLGVSLIGRVRSLVTSIRKICSRKPKPRLDEPVVSPSNYRYYEAYKSQSNDPTLPVTGVVPIASLSGGIASLSGWTVGDQTPASKPTVPWFLSGVPEQYHKHYTEWIRDQQVYRSGEPLDFSRFLAATGQMATYQVNYGSTYSQNRPW